MLELDELIRRLAQERPIFHSEADFQHSFAWELHLLHPAAEIRLERVVPTTLGRLHVDMYCQIEGRSYVLEVKYKTRAISMTVGRETFFVQDHGAQPLGRYDFLKDLMRLEALTHGSEPICGFAILLTNDSAYWCDPRGTGGTSEAFSLHEGRIVSGELNWGRMAGTGTKRKREEPIKLEAQYPLRWRDYSRLDTQNYPLFRYLALPVQQTDAFH